MWPLTASEWRYFMVDANCLAKSNTTVQGRAFELRYLEARLRWIVGDGGFDGGSDGGSDGCGWHRSPVVLVAGGLR